MSNLGRWWLSLSFLFIFPFLVSCNAIENSKDVQIVQIRDFYPIRNHSKENGPGVYNVVDLSEKTKCGLPRAMLSPTSLGISEEDFNRIWIELRKNTGQERFYKLTYGECIDDGVLITKIVDCAEGACGKDYQSDLSKIWLNTRSWIRSDIPIVDNEEYSQAGRKSTAQYFIAIPLKEVPEKKAWKAEIRYTENPDVIAMDAYVDNADFLSGKFILDYKAYYLSGNPYREGSYDRQGLKQGKSVIYYDSLQTVRSVVYHQDDKMNGESVFYNENGTVATKRLYRDNREITKNGVTYGPNGEVLQRFNYNGMGGKEGQQISYYPDGKIEERANFTDGKYVGVAEYYWPNGNLKRKETFKNGRRVAEEHWFEDGKKQSVSYYNESHQRIGTHKVWHSNGKLSSERRYYANDVLAASTTWSPEGRLSHRTTYDTKGNRTSEEHWYANGQRKSLETYKNDRKIKGEFWHENGKMSQKTTYINDNTKTHESWWKDGKRFERAIFNNDGELLLDELYDEKGKLIKQEKYKR